MALILFFSLIGTVSVVGNLIVLFVVYKSKKLRHSQYVYKCSIAVSDIIWGFSLSYCFILLCIKLLSFDLTDLYEVYDYRIKEVIEKINLEREISLNKSSTITFIEIQIDYVFINTHLIVTRLSQLNLFLVSSFLLLTPVTLLVSFVSLLFASIDRYVSLTFPYRYKQINSIKIAKIVSVFIWVLSAIVSTVTILLSFRSPNWSIFFQPVKMEYIYEKDSLNQHVTAAILYILFTLLWTFTFLTLYSLYKIYKRSSSLNKSAKKGVSLEKQMGLILVFMVFAFTFSLFPSIYFNVCWYLAPQKHSALLNSLNDLFINDKNFFLSVAFLTTNSVWNFVIYNVLNKKFRSALIKAFFKCK